MKRIVPLFDTEERADRRLSLGFLLFLVLLAAACLFPAGVAAGDSREPAVDKNWKYDFSLYRGQFSDTDLRNILLRFRTDYQPSFLTVAAVSRSLKYKPLGLGTEGEGQFAFHEGRQKHVEFNGLFVLRTKNLWRHLPLNVAFGEGLSLASRNPDLENRRKGPLSPNTESEYSNKLLNYLMFEAELALPIAYHRPRAFVRIHHRSGIYGLMCPPTCGSNYIAYGMRFAF